MIDPPAPTRTDIRLLFTTRILRLFCYGFLSVVLALYLAQAGLKETQIGLLFTLTLAGDAGISLWLTTSADRFGRRRTLIIGALLMAGAGVVFIFTRSPLLLMMAETDPQMAPGGGALSRKEIDDYTAFVGRYGARGLAYIKVNEKAKVPA